MGSFAQNKCLDATGRDYGTRVAFRRNKKLSCVRCSNLLHSPVSGRGSLLATPTLLQIIPGLNETSDGTQYVYANIAI